MFYHIGFCDKTFFTIVTDCCLDPVGTMGGIEAVIFCREIFMTVKADKGRGLGP